MTNDEKRAKVITMIEDLYGDSGMAVMNLMTDYMSEANWGHLYDRLERDGAFNDDKEGDDTPEEMKEALKYVREQLDEDELTIYKATVSKNLNQRMDASTGLDDCKIIDLLEEYGENEEMPEGWWEEFGEIDDWLLKL